MDDCSSFDPLDPEVLRNPYFAYKRLRETGRFLWHSRLNAWLVPRYHDCVVAFGNPQRFAADPRRLGAALPQSSISVQTMDPPEHDGVRELLGEAFRFCSMKALERGTNALARSLLEQLARRGGGDLMADFAMPLANGAICEFLGVPSPELSSLTPISDAIIEGMDAGLDPARREPALAARQALSELAASWLRTSRPGGMLGFLESQRGAVPDFVVHNSLRVIFHAGYTSVYSALGSALHTILRERLALHPFAHASSIAPSIASSIAPAIEELLRFDGPVQVNSRMATEDADFAGGRVQRGDVLLLMLGSANRDDEVFADPERVDLRRHPNKHLAFGHGVHQCLGGSLARRVMRAGLTELATFAPALSLHGEVEHKPQATQRCLHRLPVLCGGWQRDAPHEGGAISAGR